MCTASGATLDGDELSLLSDQLGLSRDSLTDREGGVRLMTSIMAEIAIRQRWNLWFVFEGAPFQSKRAAFTHLFTNTLFGKDIGTYGRFGASFKF